MVESRVFTTFRILEISYISNLFFCFVYHSKMAQISRNYTKFFYANLYKILRYFEKFCDLLYQFFLTIQHRRHFLHTAEKLQDADCGWGRYDNTPLNPYPFTRVFTTFCILKILYISNVFFCFAKMAQISRNYTKFFYANLYKIPRYFEKFCDLLYKFF
jgi:hypothetical protein